VIKVRSLLSGLDESVLPGLIDGEMRIVGYYEDVEKNHPPAAAAAVLSTQRRAVEAKIAEMERMRKQ
jgi:hypothetical protein